MPALQADEKWETERQEQKELERFKPVRVYQFIDTFATFYYHIKLIIDSYKWKCFSAS